MEIVVDAYTEEECAMAWYCHLEDGLTFPFEARVRQTMPASPLRTGEKVSVTGLAHDQLCRVAIFVRAQHNERELLVPLAQLVPIRADQSHAACCLRLALLVRPRLQLLSFSQSLAASSGTTQIGRLEPFSWPAFKVNCTPQSCLGRAGGRFPVFGGQNSLPWPRTDRPAGFRWRCADVGMRTYENAAVAR